MSPQHHTPGANTEAAAARPGEAGAAPAPSAPEGNAPGPAGAPAAESGTAPTEPATATAPPAAATATPPATTEATPAASAGTTEATPAAPAAAAAATGTAPAATAAAGTQGPDGAVAVATAVGTTPPGVTAATGVGGGRPRKPILAGAAILGAALIAVPLLLAGSAKDESPDTAKGPAAEGADTVLNPNDARAALDDYAPAQPSSPPAPEPPKEEAPKPADPEPAAPAPAPEPSTSSPAEKKPEPAPPSEQQAEKKPQPRTAATAVQELAARGGRHICYRVYLADRGWQAPVCDGAEAGTFGKDIPIKAINIASAGTKGVRGNGAHVVEGWKTGSKWASAVDGVDMYLGSTNKADSPLQGFTIMAVNGVACQNAQVKGKNWMGLGCTQPGSWRYGGSPMDLKLQLRGVRFTV
ncbi:hypothetical protein [Streptomyces sp. NPDC047014]|uniref:hypothetical protein n=1 Tax=Streptomyces sp. NPDC047014 TaxID=3155736 RepID=UPI0033E313E5